MLRLPALGFIVLLAGLGACQPAATTPPRQITSLGFGHVTVYPDYAELTVEASFVRPRLKESVAEVQRVVDQVLALSKKYAPGPHDVQVSSTSSNKEFKYVNDREVLAGYKATQSITVHIGDLRQLTPYLEALLATPVNSITNLSYGHSRADSLRHEASVLALADAMKAADKMCVALHARRGAVLSASDVSSPESSQSYFRAPSAEIGLYTKSFGGRGFKINPDLLRFDSQCTLSSALE